MQTPGELSVSVHIEDSSVLHVIYCDTIFQEILVCLLTVVLHNYNRERPYYSGTDAFCLIGAYIIQVKIYF